LTISPLSWDTPKDISQIFTCQRALGILLTPLTMHCLRLC